MLTGEDVAIKVIDKDKIDEISRLHIHKEVISLRTAKLGKILMKYKEIKKKLRFGATI